MTTSSSIGAGKKQDTHAHHGTTTLPDGIFMHWMQNNHESMNPILLLLLGTQDPNISLLLL